MCCRRIYRCHLEYNIHRFGDETLPGKNATWNTTFIALGMKDHLEKCYLEKIPPGKNATWNTTFIILGMKDHLKNILTGIPHCLWIQCHFERELALQLLIMRFHADQYIDRIIVYMQIYDIR